MFWGAKKVKKMTSEQTEKQQESPAAAGDGGCAGRERRGTDLRRWRIRDVENMK